MVRLRKSSKLSRMNFHWRSVQPVATFAFLMHRISASERHFSTSVFSLPKKLTRPRAKVYSEEKHKQHPLLSDSSEKNPIKRRLGIFPESSQVCLCSLFWEALCIWSLGVLVWERYLWRKSGVKVWGRLAANSRFSPVLIIHCLMTAISSSSVSTLVASMFTIS